MATQHWRLVVTELGASTPDSEVTVEADNWMAALRRGRGELGEDGGVPTGASCAVSPDGGVTVLDPPKGRRFVLSPLGAAPEQDPSAGSGAEPPRETDAPASEASPGGQQSAQTSENKAKRVGKGTVAYMQSPLASPSSKEVPVGDGAGTPSGESPKAHDSAPSGLQSDKPPAGGAEPSAERSTTSDRPAARGPASEPDATSSPQAAGSTAPEWEVLLQRDEEPSEDNPLRYRERTYLVPQGTSNDAAEALLRDRLEELQRDLAALPQGKFCNLAVFDHRWTGRPKHPPVATLQWKDWRGDPQLDFPLARSREKAVSLAPQARPARGRHSTGEQDQKLAQAFEACQDLLFLETSAEALDFVVRLLQELIPSEAISGCLYDINTDELRFVAVDGPGGEARKGDAVAPSTGLFGHAAKLEGAAERVDDLANDARFDAEAEGRPGLDARTALYVSVSYDGRLLAMLQLLNRQHRAHYKKEDGDLAVYIAGQLAEFLHQARIKPDRPRG